jgi:hypothetical protein
MVSSNQSGKSCNDCCCQRLCKVKLSQSDCSGSRVQVLDVVCVYVRPGVVLRSARAVLVLSLSTLVQNRMHRVILPRPLGEAL